MSSGIELVIFDCDGVLVDTERLAVRVDVQVLAQLGWVITEAEVVERFVGLSDSTIREMIEAHTGRRLADNWEQEFQHLYRSAFAEGLTAVDGIVEALEGTSPEHFVLAVQWHPERSTSDAPSRALFSSLVEAARARHLQLQGEFESV